MTCGCTDTLYNKNLKLEDMRNMSIDDIINLYRNGYKLENIGIDHQINVLASVEAKMTSATGFIYTPGSEVRLMALFTNSTIEGMTRWKGYKQASSGGACEPDFYWTEWCSIPTRYGLKDLMYVDISSTLNYGCLKTYGCTTGNCVSCSAWDESAGNMITDIPVIQRNMSNPSPVSNFNVAALDKSIQLTWNAVSDPSGMSEVFAYKIEVWLGSTRNTSVVAGYAQDGQLNVVIGDLTNGQLYTVDIQALSHSQTISTLVSRTVTPTGPITGNIHFLVKDTGNNPLSGVTVTVDSNNRGTTNGSGILDVTGLTASPSGTNHSYALTKSGYTTIGPKNAVVYPVQTTNVTENMATATAQCLAISTPTAVPSTVTIGDNVVLSANITPSGQAFNVDFKEGSIILGTVTGASGTATLNWSTTGKSAGVHNITAYIGGTSPCESPSPVAVTLNNPSGTVGAVRFHVNCGGTTCDVAHILLQGIEKGLTGPDGTVIVQNIPVGSRTFTIRKSGYNDGSVTVNVIQNVTTDANLVTLSLAGAGGGSGMAMLLGLVGIAALGVMMTAPKSKPPSEK